MKKLPQFIKIQQVTIFLWIVSSAFVIMVPRVGLGADQPRLYEARGKRDPFVSLVAGAVRQVSGDLAAVESLEDVHVEGVVMDADPRLSAVVANGTVLKTGDEVGLVRVLEIHPEGARFSVNGVEGFRLLYQQEEDKH